MHSESWCAGRSNLKPVRFNARKYPCLKFRKQLFFSLSKPTCTGLHFFFNISNSCNEILVGQDKTSALGLQLSNRLILTTLPRLVMTPS
jgi:hypothetical protein